LVLKPQFFKSLRPSKVKTKTALAKTKTSKYCLKTKPGLKDYIAGLAYGKWNKENNITRTSHAKKKRKEHNFHLNIHDFASYILVTINGGKISHR